MGKILDRQSTLVENVAEVVYHSLVQLIEVTELSLVERSSKQYTLTTLSVLLLCAVCPIVKIGQYENFGFVSNEHGQLIYDLAESGLLTAS